MPAPVRRKHSSQASRALEALASRHADRLGSETANLNLHFHSFFSYNAEGFSPSHIAWEARKAGLYAAGLCDFDVLDGLESIRICVGYACADGNPVPNPVDSDYYEGLYPVYEEVPGWQESTLGARTLEELPEAARDYIHKIEEVVGAPIDIISTGPDRVETIVLRHPFGD